MGMQKGDFYALPARIVKFTGLSPAAFPSRGRKSGVPRSVDAGEHCDRSVLNLADGAPFRFNWIVKKT
jgi:hypothetical protein